MKDYLNQLRKRGISYILQFFTTVATAIIIVIVIAITTIVIINTLYLFNFDVSQVSALGVNFAQLPLARS